MAAGDMTATNGTLSLRPCAVFDGVDDYVEIPHDASQLGANLSNGFTISAWINPRSAGEGNFGFIIDKSTANGGVNGFMMMMDNAPKVAFKINNGTSRTTGLTAVPYLSWTHILITVSSAQLSNFYVNGTLSGTANQDLVQPISTITTTNAMRIGNIAGATTRTFDGGIRSVKMWNRVLTTTEIAQDYAGLIPVTSGLILDVPLERDYTEKAKALTLTNSGSYLNFNMPNKVLSDVNSLKRVAVTDKLFVVNTGFPEFHVISTARAA
jgi:hypothetical protein